MGFCFSPLTAHALRLTVSEMAQDRLEDMVTGTHPLPLAPYDLRQ
jgi:hypothetical protein